MNVTQSGNGSILIICCENLTPDIPQLKFWLTCLPVDSVQQSGFAERQGGSEHPWLWPRLGER